MIDTELIRWLITGACTLVIGFFKYALDKQEDRMKVLESELRSNKNDLQTVKQQYLHKDDFKDFKNELRAVFEEIKQDLRELKHVHRNKEQ
jgi:Tfp pilus assembly protein PilO